MHVSGAAALDTWANFYVIVGSAAAGLTGLQFVVMTLIASASRVRGGEETLAAFGSPNVVHFCAALLIAAILGAPWHTLLQAGIPVVLTGVAGLFYCARVLQRARRQTIYQPVLEDWIWHNILPFAAYATLTIAGIALSAGSTGSLFEIAGAELLLLFIGIHNAWDTVTYVTLEQGRREEAESKARSDEKRGEDPPP
jgi:hypothetical protein